MLVTVAEQLRDSGSPVHIVNLGQIDLSAFPRDERERLLKRAEAAGVLTLGPTPYTELLRWLAHARAGYMLYQENELYALSIPTKMFEYFTFGLPIIACDVGQPVDALQRGDAVALVAPYNVAEHVSAINRILVDHALAKRMSTASQAYAQQYDYRSELRRLIDLYASITAPEKRSPHLDAALPRW
jgi:glycosyltransferase involved in cell wall biosynthesis